MLWSHCDVLTQVFTISTLHRRQGCGGVEQCVFIITNQSSKGGVSGGATLQKERGEVKQKGKGVWEGAG